MKNVKTNSLFIFAMAILFVSIAAAVAISLCSTTDAKAKEVDTTVYLVDKEIFTIDEVQDISVEPTRLGYKFAGWYSDADYSNRVTDIDSLESETLYAKWEEKTIDECYNVQSDTYQISTFSQLKDIRKLATYDGRYGTYVIDRNISLTRNITMTEEWSPITETFVGTFEGNGYTISNMNIVVFKTGNVTEHPEEFEPYGFFSFVCDGTINNVNFTKVTITNKGTYDAAPTDVGIVAGMCKNGTLNNCYVNGEIDIKFYYSFVGGIVGAADGATIYDCSNEAEITGYGTIGGIVGAATNYSTIERCDNRASVTYIYDTESGCAAGIVGRINTRAMVDDCANYGTIIYAGKYSWSSKIRPCIAQIVGWKESTGIVGTTLCFGSCDKGSLINNQKSYFSNGAIGRTD